MSGLRCARRVERIRPSGIRSVLDEAERLRLAGVPTINFAIGRPDFDTPEHIKDGAKSALDSGHVHYTLNAGIIELRRAIAGKLARDNGLAIDAEHGIIVTAGACEAFCVAALGYLNPGDQMLIVTPAWTTYAAAAELCDAEAVAVPVRIEDRFLPDPQALRRALTPRTRMLVLNSPNNPTGAVYPEALLREIAAIAAEAELLVVSDEIYERIIYGPTRHVAFAKLPGMAERTLTMNGLGKAYSMTGWRVGYLAGAAERVAPLVRIHQNLVASACAFAQWGALRALDSDDACVEAMRAEYEVRRNILVDCLADVPGLRVVPPEGTFYSFPQLDPHGPPADQVALRLLQEAHVATVPGTAFGKGFDHHLRLSFCTSADQVREGARRVAAALTPASARGS